MASLGPLEPRLDLDPAILDRITRSSTGLPFLGAFQTSPRDYPHWLLVTGEEAALLIVTVVVQSPRRQTRCVWTELDGRDDVTATTDQEACFIAAVEQIKMMDTGEQRPWLGATNSRWRPLMLAQDRYQVHHLYQVLLPPFDRPRTSPIVPSDVRFRPADERDVPEIARTSEVPRPEGDYLDKLVHTSCLQPASAEWQPAVAWCITYPDGSLGTLHVAPGQRRRGLAKLVIEHRMAQMAADRRPFCYVGPLNGPSQGLFQSLGFRPAWDVFWTLLRRPEEPLE